MTPLAKLLEAALFAASRPLTLEALGTLEPEASPAAVSSALDELREHYDVDGHGVELIEQGGGWQILTRAEFAEAIERAQVAVRPQRLSAAALETLAIVAYRQPIGRAEVEEIRGVQVGSVLKSLHERGLVDVVGRSEGLGRPLLYGTTSQFLEQFALRHLEELPRADELAIALRGAGAMAIAPWSEGGTPVIDIASAASATAKAAKQKAPALPMTQAAVSATPDTTQETLSSDSQGSPLNEAQDAPSVEPHVDPSDEAPDALSETTETAEETVTEENNATVSAGAE